MPNCTPMADGGMRKCSAVEDFARRGLVPNLGWGTNPPCQFAVLSHNSGPSEFVIPAKAGIHALTSRKRTPTAIPPPTSTRRPHFVSRQQHAPYPDSGRESRGGGGAAQMTSKRFQATGTHFHTSVCRRQPA